MQTEVQMDGQSGDYMIYLGEHKMVINSRLPVSPTCSIFLHQKVGPFLGPFFTLVWFLVCLFNFILLTVRLGNGGLALLMGG